MRARHAYVKSSSTMVATTENIPSLNAKCAQKYTQFGVTRNIKSLQESILARSQNKAFRPQLCLINTKYKLPQEFNEKLAKYMYINLVGTLYLLTHNSANCKNTFSDTMTLRISFGGYSTCNSFFGNIILH